MTEVSMTEESVKRAVLAAEERDQIERARRLLSGVRPEAVTTLCLAIPIALFPDVLLGEAHHDAVLCFGLIVLGAGLLLSAAIMRRPYPPAVLEDALDALTRGSERADLNALIAFTNRQRWTPEETVRVTARHLPMARRALAQERRFYPGGLERWIEALRKGGVVSEDLDAVARRVEELRSLLNADLTGWTRRDRRG